MPEYSMALAKGELGGEIESYFSQRYALRIRLNGRPLNFRQRAGKIVFRPMQSKDVPWYVAERGGYGITGLDLVRAYSIEYPGMVKILKPLGFGRGDIAIFGRYEPKEGKIRVAVPYYYRNFLASGEVADYVRRRFGEYSLVEVSGSTEGFVADGTAEIGLDFTTFFLKSAKERRRTTLRFNGLTVLETIMPTEAVLIAKNRPEESAEKFERILNDRDKD